MKRFLVNTAAFMTGALLLAAPALAAAPAAEVAEVVAEVAQAAPAVPNPGNNGFMMTATVLVLLMILPGLALFYGGLTRSKNMLSTMTQIGAAASLAMLVWVMWGYGLAFGPEGNEWISWGKFFLAGVTPDSTAATFTDEVISEYIFISFQMTFAAITAALVLGSVVERMKFSATMVFTLVWLTIVYFPIAHMVWEARGFFFAMGALDFAGGTVVHINAGISALVAAFILGKRRGYPNEPMPPHSLTLTMVGTGPVGGLVRLQRRLGARSQRLGCAGDDQHLRCHGGGRPLLDADRAGHGPQGFGAGLLLGRDRRPRRGDPGGGQLGPLRRDPARRGRLDRLLLLRRQGEAGARL